LSAEKKTRTKQEQAPPPALRLRLQWRRGKWRLLKQIHLPSKALADTTLPQREKSPAPLQGLWFEALDRQGRVLQRRRILEPLPLYVDREVKLGKMERVAANPDEFFIDLLMPAVLEIAAVRLLANPNPFQPEVGGVTDKPTLLAVFELPPEGSPDKPDQKTKRQEGQNVSR
jgi:hypothetical protein